MRRRRVNFTWGQFGRSRQDVVLARDSPDYHAEEDADPETDNQSFGEEAVGVGLGIGTRLAEPHLGEDEERQEEHCTNGPGKRIRGKPNDRIHVRSLSGIAGLGFSFVCED